MNRPLIFPLISLARLLCALLLPLLAACASAPPVSVPVEVKIPVPVPCRPPAVAEPDWPLNRIRPGDGLVTKTRYLLAEIDTRRAYEDLLKAALASCE